MLGTVMLDHSRDLVLSEVAPLGISGALKGFGAW